MPLNTHLEIDQGLNGRVVEQGGGRCSVEFVPTPQMRADSRGLVHGGFIFGAADYAAMAAVNEPTVVLGSANVRFLKPCRVGDQVRLTAEIVSRQGAKSIVSVKGHLNGGAEIFAGDFTCFTLPRHVLDQ